MMLRRISALALLAPLAACGTASDAITFKAPAGYAQAASIGPFMQIWNTPDKQNVMMLIALPAKIDLDKSTSQSDLQDADVKVKKHVKICGNQEAVYADIVGEAKNTGTGQAPRKMHIEFVATNVSDKTYMAMYMRPLNAPVNPAADAAIRDICPK